MKSSANAWISRGESLILLATLALGAAVASADQTYAIKLQLAAGQKWSFDTSSSMTLKGQVTANGQVAQTIDQQGGQRRKGEIEVLAVDANGLPSSLRVTYDAESANTGQAAAQQAPPFALAGKTVTLRRENGAIANDLPQQPDAGTLAELNRMLEPDTSIYPKEPVALNQEWNGDPATLGKQFQLGPDDKAVLTCKLLGVTTEDGRSVADIGLTGQLVKVTKEGVPAETQIALTGKARMDLLTGETTAGEITGKITTHGSGQVNGANGPTNVAVDATGDIVVHQSARILSGNGAGAFPPAMPQLQAAPAAQNPFAPPAQNPLAPSPSFAGSYQGDQLGLILAPEADHLTGVLALAGKKFPVVAHVDGSNNLSGTFDSDGAKFNFTATLDNAGILTLKSDNTIYKLQKAMPNPLAPPTRQNPLKR